MTNPKTRQPDQWAALEQLIKTHRQRIRLCGPLAVAHLLQLLNHDVDVTVLCQPYIKGDPRGVRLDEVWRLCRRFEPKTELRQFSPDDVFTMPLPSVLVVNDHQHCVVIEAVDRPQGTVHVWDPADQRRKPIDIATFHAKWTGLAIVPRPVPLSVAWLETAQRAGLAMVAVAAACRWIGRRREQVRAARLTAGEVSHPQLSASASDPCVSTR